MTHQAYIGGASNGDTKRGLELTPAEVKSTTIKDHDGEAVTLSWCPRGRRADLERVPPFPFQVYVLKSAAATAADADFPTNFALFAENLGGLPNADTQYRFEVYSQSQPSILACVEHQRQEVKWRNRNGIWPRLVSDWAEYPDPVTNHGPPGYQGFILVVDTNTWENNGIIFVSFDPAAYANPAEFWAWNFASHGDIDVVHAAVHDDLDRFTEELERWWRHAGGEWTQNDLARRNDGGFSPALYPAVDPAAHEDAEYEDEDEAEAEDQEVAPLSDLEADRDVAERVAEDGFDDGFPSLIYDTFRPNELWVLPSAQDKRFRTETHEDTAGHCTVSVWDSKKSALRPPFSFTLYCSRGAPFAAEAVFGCLNKGLIADEAWTLDVKRGFETLDAAYGYHSREAARRTPSRVEQRRHCIQLILHKIASQHLPTELLDHVEQYLVPPVAPTYANDPSRPFENFFLYFDPGPSKPLSEGPLLVYSKPLLDPPTHAPRRYAGVTGQREPGEQQRYQRDLLRVRNLRFWYRVADELHILWSLCSPRSEAIAPAELPAIHLRIEVPRLFTESDIEHPRLNHPPAHCFLILNYSEPVTLHQNFPTISRLVYESLELTDLTTGFTYPPLPYSYPSSDTIHCTDSWASTAKLGLRRVPPRGIPEADLPQSPFHTLEPHTLCRSFNVQGIVEVWWQKVLLEGRLLDGHEYALRLNDHAEVSRWTFGRLGALKGPYNLPPLPLRLEKEVRFTYQAR